MIEKFLGGLLSGALIVLSYYAGKFLVYFGYGKKGSAALKETEGELPKGLSIFFGVLLFVWAFFGLFFYFAFIDSADAGICLGIAIVCPIIYILWFIYARLQVPRLLQTQDRIQRLRTGDKKRVNDSDDQDLGRIPIRQAQANDWTCTCGRVNPKYISTCACGISRKDLGHK